MTQWDVRPLSVGEYEVLSKFLEGNEREYFLLRQQLDSLRFASVYYRGSRLLGLGPLRKTLNRRRGRVQLRVGWGVGAEDWMLGDRRHHTLTDVAATLTNGDRLDFELHISGGILSELRVSAERVSRTHLSKLEHLPIAETFYTGDESRGTRDASPIRREYPSFLPQRPTRGLSELQEWILSLDTLEISSPWPDSRAGTRLPAAVRRAPCASSDEIIELEERLRISVPWEMRQFWSLTNGASFLGWPLRGTYDSTVVSANELLLLEDLDGDGAAITIAVGPAGVDSREIPTRITLVSRDASEPVRWHGFRAFLEFLIEKVLHRERVP